jgi:hypothetical protein
MHHERSPRTAATNSPSCTEASGRSARIAARCARWNQLSRASGLHASAPTAIPPICCGPIDMRAQAEVPSARRTDTPEQVRVKRIRALMCPSCPHHVTRRREGESWGRPSRARQHSATDGRPIRGRTKRFRSLSHTASARNRLRPSAARGSSGPQGTQPCLGRPWRTSRVPGARLRRARRPATASSPPRRPPAAVAGDQLAAAVGHCSMLQRRAARSAGPPRHLHRTRGGKECSAGRAGGKRKAGGGGRAGP